MESISEVINLFTKEYLSLVDKFNIIELTIPEALINGEKDVNSPGVYVFWHDAHGVVKVGKSQANSKKRFLQHIDDNTHNNEINMQSFKDDRDASLLLINIKNRADIHWILSLEAFLEWNTNPKIKSARMG